MKQAEPPSPRSYVMSRRARTTAETGRRILDATVELFVEVPYAQLTLAAVAERAGVTVQTVIRRFGDKESLVAAAARREVERVAAQRTVTTADLRSIVDTLLEHYAQAADVALRLIAEEDTSPTVARLTAGARQLHREWCEQVFAPTLDGLRGADRQRRLAQLVAVCDVHTWKLLHRDAGLSQAQTRTALLELLEPLLITTTTPSTSPTGADRRKATP